MSTQVKFPRSIAAVSGLAVMALIGGCANTYGANEVSAGSVGQSATVYEGVVQSVRAVKIKPDQNYLGAATGAVIGGVAGSQVGGGSEERTVGAVAGAVAGGVIGNEVAKAGNTRDGYAYVIQLADGKVVELTQGADIYMEPGTQVFVSYGTDRVRISPRYIK